MNKKDHLFGMNGCFERGRNFEEVAMSILTREGFEPQRAELEDDIYRHVDFWAIGTNGRSYGFDAKAMKSLSRGQPLQQEWAFVEWRNVYGYPGWLVKGADMLIFERVDDVVIVRRSDLLNFCIRKTDKNRRVESAWESKYCMYSRKGRSDVISLFKFEDLDIQMRVMSKCQS